MEINYRLTFPADALQLSFLFQSVYIHAYGQEGVSLELANFMATQFSKEKITADIISDKVILFIATHKENPVGVALVEMNKAYPVGNFVAPELNKLYVLSHFLGFGVGHQLITKTEAYLAEKGETELWLWVYVKNDRAIKFYERQKYEWIGNAFFQMEVNKYENKVLKKTLKQ